MSGEFTGANMWGVIHDMRANLAQWERRIVSLEQQVANHAIRMKNIADLNHALQADTALKSQAAQQQAQGYANERDEQSNLYAPLRSDTKPLLEMAAFVRRIAELDSELYSSSAESIVYSLASEAQEILKRST
jgi:predicted amino acid-binding ACT domain protein